LGGVGNKTANCRKHPSVKPYAAVPQGGTDGNAFPVFILGWTTVQMVF
jgi:hypothetical protein